MDKIITVILPVYNAGKYLSQAIESILNQTFKEFEFIIINDGSTDKSIDIINHYAKADDRIVVINRENRGLIYTLNEGIEKSKGKYIARMDQDDVSINTRLELQYQYMLENNCDICGGNFTIIDENNKILSDNKVSQTQYGILLTMASNVPFAHPSVMIKKDFLIKKSLMYGLNGNRNAEDMDLWLTMYNNGAKFGNINSKVLQYRVLSSSMSHMNAKKIKYEKEIQLNNFMKKNKTDFEKAFYKFFSQGILEDELKLSVIRASLRYALIYNNFSIYFKCIKKINLFNLIVGTLSFIKLKINI